MNSRRPLSLCSPTYARNLPPSHITCRIRFHVPAVSLCVCLVCVLCGNVSRLVHGQRGETLLFKVDTSLTTLEPTSSLWRLPTLIYDPDPWPEILLVTSLTHTHTDRHAHLSLTSCEKSLYKWCHSLSGCVGCVWPGCAATLPNSSFGLDLLQGVAKQYYICKVNGHGQTI